jgi:cell division topological specificity factor
MGLLDVFEKLLGRTEAPSKNDAKKRLQLVLLHDRAELAPEKLEEMKREILQVVSKYIDIDLSALEVNLERVDQSVALVANIPIRKKRMDE